MNKTMKISEVYQPRSSRIIKINMKEPKVNEILIKVKACGICGSEYFSWNNADNPPIYLGHEASGEVICVGKGVLGFKPGDNVTGLFRDSFAEYSVINSRCVMKFPKALRFDEAALGEPISCVISGALRTEVGLGKTIVIIGLGFMGLMVLQLMRLKGAYKIIAIDTREEMSELAKHHGADEFYTPESVPDKYLLMDYKGKNGVDIVIECTGKEEAFALAIKLLKCHSILSIVGYHQGGLRNVDLQMLNRKATDIINAHEKRIDFKMNCMDIGMKLVEKGQLKVKDLMTHYYNIDDIDMAFKDFEKKSKGYIKGILRL